jgi:hypothetical protein
MKVILFGAGASYGSEQASPYCPPLGLGLFDELQRQYPKAWGTLPDSYGNRFRENFELGMKEVWDSNSYDTSVLLQCIGEYFARFRPTTGNTYSRLLEMLKERETIAGTTFSTLNYECLLEYAIRTMGYDVHYELNQPSTNRILTVLKIHGSCNFLPIGIKTAPEGIRFAANQIKWDTGCKFADASEVAPYVAGGKLYPAMAVFMEGKPVHTGSSLIRKLQEFWAGMISQSDRVGLVGVRPNIADRHIWGPLAATNAEIVVIGDSVAYGEWAKTYRREKATTVVGKYFAQGLPDFVKAFSD